MGARALDQAGTARTKRRCWGLFEWLCRVWIVLFRPPKGGDACLYIPDRIIHRPDPCLYSQFLLMQLGLEVTWDNPDVVLYRPGVVKVPANQENTYDLTAATDYDVVVTVHNSSREKPAGGTQIDIRWVEFGAGGQIRHPIATVAADVPTWPGTIDVNAVWRTPGTPGHYCIEVELSHPDDGNPANNRAGIIRR